MDTHSTIINIKLPGGYAKYKIWNTRRLMSKYPNVGDQNDIISV